MADDNVEELLEAVRDHQQTPRADTERREELAKRIEELRSEVAP